MATVRNVVAVFILAVQLLTLHSYAGAATVQMSMYSGLLWRLVGPFRGGRVLTVSGIPGNPSTFYFGAVGGGVWKTIDAGRTWTPIFDSQHVASIGAIAVAPSNPNVIYVGSGEADMRSDIIHGNGVYRSSDGGATWTRIGLTDTRQIGRIAIDPRNANRLFVAALGHAYGPNTERGVFRSDDAGKTWSKVLYKDADTGAIDVVLDPRNSDVLYAALWQTRRPPWNIYPPSNGPGSGLFKSIDGGNTWQQLLSGLPRSGVGHTGIAVSPSDSQRVYAVVDALNGGLYRSDDAGAHWMLVDNEERIWKRGWYFSKVTVDPRDRDIVYVSNTSLYRSTDGGHNFTAIKGAPGGDDYHMLWIDPMDANRMILGSDQGAIVSLNGGKTWSSWYNQPTGQFYHVATDHRFPYWIYGAQQDSGALATPSRSNHRQISFRDWQPIAAGGESGYIAIDPHDSRVVYGGTVDRFDWVTGQDQDLSPERAHPGVYRHTWTLPVTFSPRSGALYYSTQVLFRSADRGHSWQIISPDLSRLNPPTPSTLDATTAKDKHGGNRQGVIYSIGPSPLRDGLIWAGTDDGLIWVTHNEGRTWRNVTPNLSAWSKVGNIEPSAHDAATAYASVDRHRLEDDRPYIYKTHDSGMTWTLIAHGIPDGSFVNVVREDPVQRGLLFAGTETGVFVSFDEGGSWLPLQMGMPVTSVRDLAINQGDLVAATHGRGFYVLDTIVPLRQLVGRAISAPWLFSPATAIRVRSGNDQGTPLPLDTAAADNPPVGAAIDYYLTRTATTPLHLEIFDSGGHLVRGFLSSEPPKAVDPKTLDVPAAWHTPAEAPSSQSGMHRFIWDFRYGRDDGVLAPPGRYTVRMSVDGNVQSRPLFVRKDPRVRATDQQLLQQFTFARRVEAAQAQAAAAYRDADALRKTTTDPALLAKLNSVAGGPPPHNPDDSIGAAETNLHSLHYLSTALSNLKDAVESADAAPTADMRKAFTIDERDLRNALARWKALRSLAR